MAQPRILIVDDDADIREILALELKFEKCEITECDSYLSASHCLESQTFDLIISDMSLGDGNGLELLHKLRDVLRLQTPFVLMTGDHRIQESKVKSAGAEALIAKPFMLHDVVPRFFAWATINQELKAS